MIHIDFESRSKVDIWEVGAWEYSKHPSTEILCLAYAIDDQQVRLIPVEQLFSLDPFNNELLAKIKDPTEIFVAHNALFEQCIWQNILVKRYGWPPIKMTRWRCTAAKAAARGLPRSLKECGKALRAPILKSDEGHRVMMKLCKPNAKGGWYEDPEDFKKLYEYCIQDVEAERSIDGLMPDLTPDEQQIWFLDQLINRRGVQVDTDAVSKALDFIEIFTQNSNDRIKRLTNGQLEGVSRRMAVMQWCQAQGVDIEGYTKAVVADTLSKELPPVVRAVLETRVALGKTSVAKYRAIHESTASDGRLRDLFVYHGASTGRWTGKLVQVQNLPKGTESDTDTAIAILKQSTLPEFEVFYPDVMGTLSSCIRGMLTASPGNQLYVADYAAIEARVVLWLAGEEYGLEQFKQFDAGIGEEPYILMAQNIYSRLDIPKKGVERQLGKTTILGCGFGMGASKFHATCNAWGITVDEALAKRAVDAYRSLYPNVRRSWADQETAAIGTVKTGENRVCGKVEWYMDGVDLCCRLPSGRSLTYNRATTKYIDTPWGARKEALVFMSVNGKTHQWDQEQTYGGKLVENITQAVARDIMATAMYRAEMAGYRVAFSVHDEIVSDVPKDFGSVKAFEDLLCVLPVWADGLPIKAKGFSTQRYRKD